jgi:dihydropteroate synthase
MENLTWKLRDRLIDFSRRPLVMGIVNVTPDSFSDGGEYHETHRAVDHGLRLIAEGADILDIGGESTRPGAEPVSVDDELARVVPVVQALRKRTTLPISVDTMKAEVACQSLEAGASIINDVSGFRDPQMIEVASQFQAGLVVMHMRGTPQTMQQEAIYSDVVREVGEFFAQRLKDLGQAGIPIESICIDPGIGFSKRNSHNFDLLANLGSFADFNRPLCLGVSRKGFIGKLCGRETSDRLAGSLAIACFAAARGEAQLLRVHDVAPTRDAALVFEEIARYRR